MIPGHSRLWRLSLYRSVTPEVAGSSPVAPVFQVPGIRDFMFVDSDANFRSATALSGSHPAVTISVVLDRVELAGCPLKVEHSEVVLADGFRRQLGHRHGGTGAPNDREARELRNQARSRDSIPPEVVITAGRAAASPVRGPVDRLVG